jgi:hypothetical protein
MTTWEELTAVCPDLTVTAEKALEANRKGRSDLLTSLLYEADRLACTSGNPAMVTEEAFNVARRRITNLVLRGDAEPDVDAAGANTVNAVPDILAFD